MLQNRIGNLPLDLDFIRLIDEAAGMHQNISQFAVIGHQQQALCILVQTADSIDTVFFLLEVVHDRRPSLVVTRCGNDALGLIKQVIMLGLHFKGLAVDGNAVLIRIDLGA